MAEEDGADYGKLYARRGGIDDVELVTAGKITARLAGLFMAICTLLMLAYAVGLGRLPVEATYPLA